MVDGGAQESKPPRAQQDAAIGKVKTGSAQRSGVAVRRQVFLKWHSVGNKHPMNLLFPPPTPLVLFGPPCSLSPPVKLRRELTNTTYSAPLFSQQRMFGCRNSALRCALWNGVCNPRDSAHFDDTPSLRYAYACHSLYSIDHHGISYLAHGCLESLVAGNLIDSSTEEDTLSDRLLPPWDSQCGPVLVPIPQEVIFVYHQKRGSCTEDSMLIHLMTHSLWCPVADCILCLDSHRPELVSRSPCTSVSRRANSHQVSQCDMEEQRSLIRI